jgi:hypothetical protein
MFGPAMRIDARRVGGTCGFGAWVMSWFYLTILLAGLAIVLGWRTVLRAPTARRDRAILVLAATSFLWYVALIFLAQWIAPDYSDLRFGTIYANLAVMAIAGIFSLFRAPPVRRYLVASTWLLVCLWFYAMLLSSVV